MKNTLIENYESLVTFEDREDYQTRYKKVEISPIGRFRVFLIWESDEERYDGQNLPFAIQIKLPDGSL